jgi:hypothetical protein
MTLLRSALIAAGWAAFLWILLRDTPPPPPPASKR